MMFSRCFGVGLFRPKIDRSRDFSVFSAPTRLKHRGHRASVNSVLRGFQTQSSRRKQVGCAFAALRDSRLLLSRTARKCDQIGVADVLEILVNADLGRVVTVDGHLLQDDKEASEF
jgi:hypothetical protein